MDSGPNAVLGRKPNCYKWALPLPAPAKVVLQVPAGSGLVAAQLYEKWAELPRAIARDEQDQRRGAQRGRHYSDG